MTNPLVEDANMKFDNTIIQNNDIGNSKNKDKVSEYIKIIIPFDILKNY